MSTSEREKVQKIISALLNHYGVDSIPALKGRIINPSTNKPFSLSAIYKWRDTGVFPAEKFPQIDHRFNFHFFQSGEGSPYLNSSIHPVDSLPAGTRKNIETPQPIKDAIAVLGALLGPDSRPLQLSDESVQAILKVLELLSKEARKVLDQQSSPQ